MDENGSKYEVGFYCPDVIIINIEKFER